jgi:hypothetical protein
MHPVERGQFYPEWDDCIDMDNEEFLLYVIRTTEAAHKEK